MIILLSSLSMACVTREDAAPAESESAITTATMHEQPPDQTQPDQTRPVVEIVLFHGTNRCAGCINVGKWTDEVMHAYYEEAVENGTITFQAAILILKILSGINHPKQQKKIKLR